MSKNITDGIAKLDKCSPFVRRLGQEINELRQINEKLSEGVISIEEVG